MKVCQRPAVALSGLFAAALLAACASPQPTAVPLACAELPAALKSLTTLPAVRLTAASEVPADDQGHPALCRVTGVASERTGSDGRHYAIGFEMRLPVAWNHRFLQQVNGGNDGKVQPALGNLGVLEADALQRGFAVISSDSGHSDADPANAAAGLTQGNVFGLDPQARRDYGYSADDTVFRIAQALIERRYGEPPRRNYIAGCSNGGRHALVDATRWGERYDGVLAGDPGLNLPKAAVQHAWDVQSWRLANADIRQAFSSADLRVVADAVLRQCDGLDDLVDGIVGDLARCQQAFRPEALTCQGGQTSNCLAPAQVAALKRSFAGPHDSQGRALYADWPWDAGIAAGNWRFWKLESRIPPWNRMPLIATMGAGSLSYIFTTPPTPTPGTPDALLQYLVSFDFDRDAPRIYATDGAYTESAMAFMTPPDVDDPRLASLRAHGGKLIVYHGNSDPVFSVNDTTNWFARLRAHGGGDFARLYTVPGMTHCSGGPATDRFDVLGALVDWVEEGRAPQALVATVDPHNADLPAGWSRARTRPLCPWPQVPRYGGGDTEAAASFRCIEP